MQTILEKVRIDKYVSFSSINTLTAILTIHTWPQFSTASIACNCLPRCFTIITSKSLPSLASPKLSEHLPTLQRSQVTLCFLYLCSSCLFDLLLPGSGIQDCWTSLPTFESHLKTHLFRPAFQSETVTIKCIFFLYVY